MSVIKSKLNVRSEEFKANAAAMRPEGIPALRSETYKEGLTNLTKIARAWFILWENETDPDRKRVLEERLDAIQKKIEEHVEELAKEKLFTSFP